MNELKVGVVGLGWAAGAHIEGFKLAEGATVTAVCSRRDLDPAALETQFGLPLEVYHDYDAMLTEAGLDIIDICTPQHLHPQQTIAAARAGKHVLIEKPLATSFDDLKSMREAVSRAGVRSCVCFECRFSKQFQMTRAVVDEGLLGTLHYGEVDYYHGIGPWYGQFHWNVKKEFGGSSLLTAGCHALDILMWMMDAPVEEVTCYATRSSSEIFAPYEYDTTSVTIVKFAGGRIGKVASCIDCLQPYYFHVHLVGSEGSLLDDRFYSHRLGGLVKDRWSKFATSLVDSGDVTHHPYQPQFQAFIDAIQRDEEMPLTDFETAFESHRVAMAADLSAAEGRPVKMSEFD